MCSKKVLILGASRYYSKSIESARNAGYYVIAVDRSPDSEGFKSADEFEICDIVDKEGVLKIARKYMVSGVIPVNDYGVPTAAFVASQMKLPAISEETARLSTDKAAMRKKWIESGIPCPCVEIGTTTTEIRDAINKVGIPCILKPAHGYGGASRGVIVIREEKEIEYAIKFSHKFYKDKTTLVETFIEAETEHSVEVLVYNGKVYVLAVADKIKTPLPYRVDKNVLYPTILSGEKLNSLKNIVKESVLSLGIHIGPAHVELASTSDGFVLFELGARSGGGGTPEPIVPYVTGIKQFVEIVRILSGDEPGDLIPRKNYACNYHFITPREGKVKSIKGVEDIKKMKGVLDFDFFKKPGDEIYPVKVGTDRSGFIIAGAKSREMAYKLGCIAEQKLEINYEE